MTSDAVEAGDANELRLPSLCEVFIGNNIALRERLGCGGGGTTKYHRYPSEFSLKQVGLTRCDDFRFGATPYAWDVDQSTGESTPLMLEHLPPTTVVTLQGQELEQPFITQSGGWKTSGLWIDCEDPEVPHPRRKLVHGGIGVRFSGDRAEGLFVQQDRSNCNESSTYYENKCEIAFDLREKNIIRTPGSGVATLNVEVFVDSERSGSGYSEHIAEELALDPSDAQGAPDPSIIPPLPDNVIISHVELRPVKSRVARVTFTHIPSIPDSIDPTDPWATEVGLPVNYYDLRAYPVGTPMATEDDWNGIENRDRKHVPGKKPGTTREITFKHLKGDADYCFLMRAVHRFDKKDANNDGIKSVQSDLASSTPFCLGAVPPALDPCPIQLQAEAGADPETSLKLFWELPSADAQNDTCAAIDPALLTSVALKFRQGIEDYTDAEWQAATDGLDDGVGIWSIPTDASALLVPRDGLNPDAGMEINTLLPGTTYMFAVTYSTASETSPLSNHLPGATAEEVIVPEPTIEGMGTFTSLVSSLPQESFVQTNTNIGHSIYVIPNVNGSGNSCVIYADRSAGVQILKVADPYNVEDGGFTDFLPINFNDGVSSWGDGMADFLDRDRHSLRIGVNDCDGIDTGLADSFAACNLPESSQRFQNASSIAMVLLNGDAHPDMIVANFAGGDMALADTALTLDGAYIHAGQDLSPDRAGDVADGIPAFYAAIDLPPQTYLADQKFPSTRVVAADIDTTDNLEAVDVIAVVSSGPEGNGIALYNNQCRDSLGRCAAGDFDLVTTEIIDFANDADGNPLTIGLASPIHAEDVAFIDLNNDGLKDMILARKNIYNAADPLNPNFDGRNLVFRGSMEADPVDPSKLIPKFALDMNLLVEAQAEDCNSSFISTARIDDGGALTDYILIGNTLNAAVPESGTCGTEIFYGDPGLGLATPAQEILVPSAVTCHNGLIADLRNTGNGDAAIACNDADGAKIFEKELVPDADPEEYDTVTAADFFFQAYDEDVTNDIEDYRPLTDLCEDVNSDGHFDMSECFDANGRPSGKPLPGYSYAAFSFPTGSFNALALGDLDGDGVADLYLGNGGISVGASAPDTVLKQMPVSP